MTIDTNGRVALVTGGSGGIGRAVVERLAADGYDLVVHYSGNEGRAQQAVAAVQRLGRRAIAVGGDVADEDAMTGLFDAAERELGRIDAVINTAGVMILGPSEQYSLDDFDRQVRVNLRGTFVVSRLAAQRVRRGGAIINFSSTVTRTLPPTYGPYVLTKGGIEGFSLLLARELRGRDVTVNTVAPGPTATPLFLDGKDDAAVQRFAQASPLERIAEPAEIAETVAFLAGPARWINGQTLFVNGGLG